MTEQPSEYLVETIYTETGTTAKPGGQHAGILATDIRITHMPTGIMAQCGMHRSQHKNRAVAMEMIQWALNS